MNDIQKFVDIFVKLKTNGSNSVLTSISDISDVLHCTPRNSRITIKKLSELNWIEWKPGNGRGKKSTLSFNTTPNNLIKLRSQELVKQGNVKSAKELVSEYDSLFPGSIDEFESWISTILGFRTEINNHRLMDTLRIKSRMKPIYSLDPIKSINRSQIHIIRQISDTLVRYNSKTKQIDLRYIL